MIFLDTEAMPIPPWTHLLLRFIRLHDQFVPLGVIKSINIVGENTRAAMNWETCKGYVYVSDWNLNDAVHPVFLAHHGFEMLKVDGGIGYNLNGPEGSSWVVDENTDDFYTWSHDYAPSPVQTSILPSVRGIYKINLNANFTFYDDVIECWCRDNWPAPNIDTNVMGSANIRVDNGLVPGAGPTRGLGYAYTYCTEGEEWGSYEFQASARCTSDVRTNHDGIIMTLGYGAGGIYFDSPECMELEGPTIAAVNYNLSIVQLYQY